VATPPPKSAIMDGKQGASRAKKGPVYAEREHVFVAAGQRMKKERGGERVGKG